MTVQIVRNEAGTQFKKHSLQHSHCCTTCRAVVGCDRPECAELLDGTCAVRCGLALHEDPFRGTVLR